MTKYAAHDDISIYATGDTPEAAIANARADARDPEAEFETTRIRDDFAEWIDNNGWDGFSYSFAEDRDGYLVDTTDEH